MTKRILVVDDDFGIRTIVQMSLEVAAQWQVTLAASGQEGLHQARSQLFDAILLDVMMPGQDGVETFHQLRADPPTSSIPVILFTAKARRRELDALQALGVKGVITKPFEAAKLVQTVRSMLDW